MNRLPQGFRVRIGADVWTHQGGRTLVGGAPTRVLRLSERAYSQLEDKEVTVRDEQSAALAERLLAAGIAHPDGASLARIPLPQLTVVIPIMGRADRLGRLLATLPDVAVIVVDDGTPFPASADVAAAARRAGASVIRLPQNRGPAAARNAGLAEVRTPYVAFIDSDVTVPAHALEALLLHFHDPGLALVGPRVAGLAAVKENWILRYESARSSLDLWRHPALVAPRSRVAWMSSTCLIARVAAIPGGFDERMRVGEDVDIVWRLAASGWRVRYEPSVVVHHEHRAGVIAWARRKAFYGTGGAALADRHPHSIAPAILRPWQAVVLLGLCIARPWSLAMSLTAVGVGALSIRATLTPSTRSPLLVARLTLSVVLATLMQGSALALRHWWPVAAVAAVFSRRARGVVSVVAIADAIMEYIRVRPRLDPGRFALARRIDDIAYGSGVWASAIRRGSPRSLLPDMRWSRPGGKRQAEHPPGDGAAPRLRS